MFTGFLHISTTLQSANHRFWEIQDPRFLEISFINFKIGYRQIPGRCEHTKDLLCNAETILGGVRKKLGDLFWGFRVNGTENLRLPDAIVISRLHLIVENQKSAVQGNRTSDILGDQF